MTSKRLSDAYTHIKIPGFGCTYPNDFKENNDKNIACAFELTRLVHDEVVDQISPLPTLVLPIEAGRGLVKIKGGADFTLDFETLLVIPPNTKWSVAATTPILKTMLIGIGEKAKARCSKDFDLKAEAIHDALSILRKITRTNWLNELCHRYAFERSIARMSDSSAAKFLESELVKEIYYAVTRETQRDHAVPFFVELPEPLRRALTFIEQKLHDNIAADEIAAAAVTSKPTLVRLFRTHLKTSPIKYLWDRRLDEADRLLLTGRYSVSEVAALLSFSDSSSFSKSFLERFGVRPSARLPE